MTSLRAIRPTWGRCPQPPGIYRLTARMTRRGGGSFRLRSFRQLSRRSGCVPAVPYPPLRCFQSGRNTTRRAMIFQRTATTPLIRCLTPGVHFSEVAKLTHGASVRSVAFSPDGKWVATGSWDKTARVMEAATGREVAKLTHGDSVRSVAFSPDGKWVATGTDKTVRVMETATRARTLSSQSRGAGAGIVVGCRRQLPYDCLTRFVRKRHRHLAPSSASGRPNPRRLLPPDSQPHSRRMEGVPRRRTVSQDLPEPPVKRKAPGLLDRAP